MKGKLKQQREEGRLKQQQLMRNWMTQQRKDGPGDQPREDESPVEED